MKISSSFQAPILSPFARATMASITESPKAPSGRITRRAQEQRCPVVRKADCAAMSAAASTSAGSQIISGLLPPISKAKMTSGRPAKCLWKKTPVFADPVNNRPLMSALSRAPPVSLPPCTIFSTPAGRPAAANASAMSAATPGASSDGLKTHVLPANSAGTICPFGKWPGKLNGP